MTPRHRSNALAFLDAVAHALGTAPRPLGYLTISNMRLLGIKLGHGENALAGLSPLQRRDQVNAFVWLQCAAMPIVSRGIRTYDKLCREALATMPAVAAAEHAFSEFNIQVVEPFLEQIPVEALEAALAQLEHVDEIDAAAVTVEPPPSRKRERPDPLA